MSAPVPTSGLAELLGLSLRETTPDRVVGVLDVRAELRGPGGDVHHGVVSSIVETLGSIGGALWYGERGRVVGVANTTTCFDHLDADTLTAVATPVDRQEDRQVWAVEVRGHEALLVARGDLHLVNLRRATED